MVAEGEELEIELLAGDNKTTSFEALLILDGDKVQVGHPLIDGSKVTADITEAMVKAPKVTAIRYKPKKRVHKTRGHRQQLTKIKVTKIS